MKDRKINNIAPKPALIENIDYYLENGFFVFMEKFHLDRGYCCKSGCRHCPYNFKKQKW